LIQIIPAVSFTEDLDGGLWDHYLVSYTILQIEGVLVGQRSSNGWSDNIKNNYNNT
jgi:hypothetical protein